LRGSIGDRLSMKLKSGESCIQKKREIRRCRALDQEQRMYYNENQPLIRIAKKELKVHQQKQTKVPLRACLTGPV
jgi:hypothetical protein